jgi:hypothetical protein
MRLLGALLAAATLVAPTWGAECALVDARYDQPGSAWTLQFHEVPDAAMVNQTAAFTMTMPKSGVELRGDIWQPNGYAQSWGALEGPCAPKEDVKKAQTCRLWEAVVYTELVNGIEVLSSNDKSAAPLQILLPQLTSAIWYSSYRREFNDADPGDVFTFAGCAR